MDDGWIDVDAGRWGRHRVPRAREIVEGVWARDTGGSGPVVVLAHGWCADSLTNWFSCYRPLARLGWRVVGVDVCGHGHSRLSGRFSIEACAASIVSALEALDVTGAVCVGYSMGGPVTQQLARVRPDLVAGLVQVATAAHIVASGPARAGLALGGRGAGLFLEATRSVGRLVRAGHAVGAGTTLAGHGRWLVAASNKRALAEAAGELARWDSRGWVGDLDASSVVVVCGRDRGVPARAQRELADLLGGRRLEVDAGHTFCLDAGFAGTVAAAVSMIAGA